MNIRKVEGFSDWMAECAFACKMGDDHHSLPSFTHDGAEYFYWPSINDDGVIWPHGFSDKPMGDVTAC